MPVQKIKLHPESFILVKISELLQRTSRPLVLNALFRAHWPTLRPVKLSGRRRLPFNVPFNRNSLTYQITADAALKARRKRPAQALKPREGRACGRPGVRWQCTIDAFSVVGSRVARWSLRRLNVARGTDPFNRISLMHRTDAEAVLEARRKRPAKPLILHEGRVRTDWVFLGQLSTQSVV